MFSKLAFFCCDDDGAVTVDFVVLTAAICLLGAITVSAFGPATNDLANEVENQLDSQNSAFVLEASQY